MGIILNGHLTRTIKGKLLGGAMVGLRQSSQDVWNRNRLQTFAKFVSIPSGTRPPHSFLMAQISGGIALRIRTDLDQIVLNLAGGKNLELSAQASIQSIALQLDRIVSLVCNGNLSIQKLSIQLNAAANAYMNLNSTMNSDINIGAIIDVIVNGIIQINKNIELTALANMGAIIGGPSPLSPEGLARAVWLSYLSEYQETGTVGKALADALASVGGGDPEAIADAVLNKGVLKVSDFLALK